MYSWGGVGVLDLRFRVEGVWIYALGFKGLGFRV